MVVEYLSFLLLQLVSYWLCLSRHFYEELPFRWTVFLKQDFLNNLFIFCTLSLSHVNTLQNGTAKHRRITFAYIWPDHAT